MRYAISFNALSRVLLGVLGAGPSRSRVEADQSKIHVRMGWMGSVTIPTSSVTTVEQIEHIPWWLGFGIHGGPGQTWSFNGSGSGGVKMALREPAKGRLLGIPIRVRTAYVSLEDPSGFVSSVNASLA